MKANGKIEQKLFKLRIEYGQKYSELVELKAQINEIKKNHPEIESKKHIPRFPIKCPVCNETRLLRHPCPYFCNGIQRCRNCYLKEVKK